MKIGQIKIDVYFDQETGINLITASEEVQQSPQSTDNVEDPTAPGEIQLDPDSDDFEEKKSELKAAGYFYNRSSKTWRKPKVVNGSRKSARHRVSKLFLLSAIAMFAGIS